MLQPVLKWYVKIIWYFKPFFLTDVVKPIFVWKCWHSFVKEKPHLIDIYYYCRGGVVNDNRAVKFVSIYPKFTERLWPSETATVNEATSMGSHLMYETLLKQVLHKHRTKGPVPALEKKCIVSRKYVKSKCQNSFFLIHLSILNAPEVRQNHRPMHEILEGPVWLRKHHCLSGLPTSSWLA